MTDRDLNREEIAKIKRQVSTYGCPECGRNGDHEEIVRAVEQLERAEQRAKDGEEGLLAAHMVGFHSRDDEVRGLQAGQLRLLKRVGEAEALLEDCKCMVDCETEHIGTRINAFLARVGK